MPDREVERKAICYITGDIRLEYAPPNGFQIVPEAKVDGKQALVKAMEGDHPKIWKYLAIVEKGKRTVSIELGNVSIEKHIEVRGAQVSELDFVFSDTS